MVRYKVSSLRFFTFNWRKPGKKYPRKGRGGGEVLHAQVTDQQEVCSIIAVSAEAVTDGQ